MEFTLGLLMRKNNQVAKVYSPIRMVTFIRVTGKMAYNTVGVLLKTILVFMKVSGIKAPKLKER